MTTAIATISDMPVATTHVEDNGQVVVNQTKPDVTYSEDKPDANAGVTTSDASIDAKPVVKTLTKKQVLARHEKRIATIVGLLVDAYEDAGTRNFRIANETLLDCREMRESVATEYGKDDFKREIGRITDELRLWVPIDEKSVRLAQWVHCVILREKLTDAIGLDLATVFSMNEYLILIGKCLVFDVKELTGTIRAGWVEPIRKTAVDRVEAKVKATESGKPVPPHAKAFLAMVEATETAVETAKATENPALHAAQVKAKALNKLEADTKKARTSLTNGLGEVIAKGQMSPESIVGLVETFSRDAGIDLSDAFGFNPTTCTVEDCGKLAKSMQGLGKYAQMVHLRDALTKAIATMDSDRAKLERRHANFAAQTDPKATRAARIAKEQARAEAQLARVESKTPAYVEAIA